MNVLMVNTAMSGGGAATVARHLHKSLQLTKEVKCKFITGRPLPESNSLESIYKLQVPNWKYLANVFLYRFTVLEGPLNDKA